MTSSKLKSLASLRLSNNNTAILLLHLSSSSNGITLLWGVVIKSGWLMRVSNLKSSKKFNHLATTRSAWRKYRLLRRRTMIKIPPLISSSSSSRPSSPPLTNWAASRPSARLPATRTTKSQALRSSSSRSSSSCSNIIKLKKLKIAKKLMKRDSSSTSSTRGNRCTSKW